MKRNKTKTGSVDKRKRNSAAYKEREGDSRYAKKRKWCVKNGMWGFEVPEPKPWK